jgi:hypothetical protein
MNCLSVWCEDPRFFTVLLALWGDIRHETVASKRCEISGASVCVLK